MTEAVLYYGAGGEPQRVAPHAVPGAPVLTIGDTLPTSPKEGDAHFFFARGTTASGTTQFYINTARYNGSTWEYAVSV